MIGAAVTTLLLIQKIEEGPPTPLRDASIALTECLVREGQALDQFDGSDSEQLNAYMLRCSAERENAIRVYVQQRPGQAHRAGRWAIDRYLLFARRTFLPQVIFY